MRAAFTLLELLVVLAIVAIVAGGAALVAPRLDAALRLDTALHQLAADLRGARTLAVASASSVRLVLTPGGRAYRRERDDGDGYATERTRWLPRGIAVAAVGSEGTLTFSPYGDAENATVVLADRRGVRRALILNQRGRVSIAGAVG
jgi:type II secretion system protein H